MKYHVVFKFILLLSFYENSETRINGKISYLITDHSDFFLQTYEVDWHCHLNCQRECIKCAIERGMPVHPLTNGKCVAYGNFTHCYCFIDNDNYRKLVKEKKINYDHLEPPESEKKWAAWEAKQINTISKRSKQKFRKKQAHLLRLVKSRANSRRLISPNDLVIRYNQTSQRMRNNSFEIEILGEGSHELQKHMYSEEFAAHEREQAKKQRIEDHQNYEKYREGLQELRVERRLKKQKALDQFKELWLHQKNLVEQGVTLIPPLNISSESEDEGKRTYKRTYTKGKLRDVRLAKKKRLNKRKRKSDVKLKTNNKELTAKEREKRKRKLAQIKDAA